MTPEQRIGKHLSDMARHVNARKLDKMGQAADLADFAIDAVAADAAGNISVPKSALLHLVDVLGDFGSPD